METVIDAPGLSCSSLVVAYKPQTLQKTQVASTSNRNSSSSSGCYALLTGLLIWSPEPKRGRKREVICQRGHFGDACKGERQADFYKISQ